MDEDIKVFSEACANELEFVYEPEHNWYRSDEGYFRPDQMMFDISYDWAMKLVSKLTPEQFDVYQERLFGTVALRRGIKDLWNVGYATSQATPLEMSQVAMEVLKS